MGDIDRVGVGRDLLEAGDRPGDVLDGGPAFPLGSGRIRGGSGAAAGRLPHPVIEALGKVQPDDLTPRQALELLYKLKTQI